MHVCNIKLFILYSMRHCWIHIQYWSGNCLGPYKKGELFYLEEDKEVKYVSVTSPHDYCQLNCSCTDSLTHDCVSWIRSVHSQKTGGLGGQMNQLDGRLGTVTSPSAGTGGGGGADSLWHFSFWGAAANKFGQVHAGSVTEFDWGATCDPIDWKVGDRNLNHKVFSLFTLQKNCLHEDVQSWK